MMYPNTLIHLVYGICTCRKRRKNFSPHCLKWDWPNNISQLSSIKFQTPLHWRDTIGLVTKTGPGHWFLRSHSVLFQNYDKNSPKRGVSLTRSGIFIPSFSQTRLTVLGMHILAGSNFYTGKDYHLKHSTVCTKDTGEFLRVVKSRWTYLRTATE